MCIIINQAILNYIYCAKMDIIYPFVFLKINRNIKIYGRIP